MRKYGPLVEFLSFEDTVGNNMKYEYEIATYNLRNEIILARFTFVSKLAPTLNKVCVVTGLSRFMSRSEANVSQIAGVRLRLQLKGNQDRKEENNKGVETTFLCGKLTTWAERTILRVTFKLFIKKSVRTRTELTTLVLQTTKQKKGEATVRRIGLEDRRWSTVVGT
ncbi:hypothetical protein Tsp_01659 [Trichinella spiralis]|uniref:hypothetical protein n=1 Tax=Trichinella spiralis TaxID=6334 RepID=UPI0001EFC681|nr:hypothetical protein Tsp_01659 [Trichinella spiralis]